VKSLFAICYRVLFLILLTGVAMAARNSVPVVDQPLVPASVPPGSKGFMLTVNGSGFASSAVVKWNGSSRLTVVNSSTQVQADIKASDVAKAGTASVTVVNPKPGGGVSNVVYLPIRKPAKSVSFGIDTKITPQAGLVATGDFNGDGIEDFAVANYNSGSVLVYLGKGDGSFRAPIESKQMVIQPSEILAADVNNDGKLDLVILDYNYPTGQIDILLGDGKGSFSPLFMGGGTTYVYGLAAGDLNGDGNVDLITNGTNDIGLSTVVFLGNGDGTFTQGATLPEGGGNIPVLADFNGDGNLDIASPDYVRGGLTRLLVWLGNGDGTFGAATAYSAANLTAVTAADLNGDGKLDLITNGVDVFLGNGDGTFSSGASVPVSAVYGPVAVGDFNGDGKLDVGVGTFISQGKYDQQVTMLLGDGKGNFQSPLQFPLGIAANLIGFGVADFNNDGLLDYVVGSIATKVFLQGTATIRPTKLDFGIIKVGSHSRPQSATLTNIGNSALKIKSIGIGGKDSADFSETNHCGKGLPAHGSCKIKVRFSPQQAGIFSASLDINYDGGSLLQVPLSGTGVSVTVSLTPSKMTFPTQLVGTKSSAQPATLTNTGTQTVNISNIQTKAPFGETNNCPSSLMPGNSCQIEVTFQPTQKGDMKGTLEVTDDAQGSPQKVALSGTATVVKFSPTGVTFGDQKVGTKSPVVPIKLTNVGTVALSITQIALTGKDPGDFLGNQRLRDKRSSWRKLHDQGEVCTAEERPAFRRR
jgi:hypothetical protein